MISLNGNGPEGLVCAFVLSVLGLYILYWVIRLAVRHALIETGVGSAPDRRQLDDRPDWPT